MFYDADGGAHSITECHSILGVVQNNLLDQHRFGFFDLAFVYKVHLQVNSRASK